MRELKLTFCLLALSIFLAAPLAAYAQTGETKAEAKEHSAPPSNSVAKVSLDFFQLAFMVSGSGGKGQLVYKGKTYQLKVGGAGIGGFGMQRAKAVGEVYNLRKLSDFEDTYFELRAGFAVGAGQGVLWLENSKGVILKLKSKTKGLALTTGADGMILQFAKSGSKAKSKGN